MRSHRSGPPCRRSRRLRDDRDDAGGIWIATGAVLGVVVYLFIVAMLIAGFHAVLPLVVLPPVVAGLIGANGLLGGPRRGQGRSPGKGTAGEHHPPR